MTSRFDRRIANTPNEWRGPLVDVVDTADAVRLAMEDLELLCELLETVKTELNASISEEGMQLINDSLRQARAAQPAPPRPTDQELLALMPESMRDEFAYAARTCSRVTGGRVKPGIFRVALNTAALEYAHAVLAFYGQEPPPTSNLAQI